MDMTVVRINSPGQVTSQGARSTWSRAEDNMLPHSGMGGCTPKPKNPRVAASRMAEEKLKVAPTKSGAAQLGKTARHIKRKSLAPTMRLALT
jgi:hypothetical protein